MAMNYITYCTYVIEHTNNVIKIIIIYMSKRIKKNQWFKSTHNTQFICHIVFVINYLYFYISEGFGVGNDNIFIFLPTVMYKL